MRDVLRRISDLRAMLAKPCHPLEGLLTAFYSSQNLEKAKFIYTTVKNKKIKIQKIALIFLILLKKNPGGCLKKKEKKVTK